VRISAAIHPRLVIVGLLFAGQSGMIKHAPCQHDICI
jgi:hypothetical protein